MAKKYSEEERREALVLASEIGVRGASERLGINQDTIYTWISKAKQRHATAVERVEQLGGLEGANHEIDRLQRALREKEEEIEILQEALGFFVKRRKK